MYRNAMPSRDSICHPRLYPTSFSSSHLYKIHHITLATLVRASSSLAGLELLKVPVANLHVALVVVHALGESLRGAGAVVVAVLVLLGGSLGLDLLGSRL